MAECKTIKCTCQSAFQDETYGKGMRLHNPIGKTQDSGYKCTVCGRVADSSSKKK